MEQSVPSLPHPIFFFLICPEDGYSHLTVAAAGEGKAAEANRRPTIFLARRTRLTVIEEESQKEESQRRKTQIPCLNFA